MSILKNSQKKMFSNENSETAIFCEISLRIQWYFSQISEIKIELSTGEKDMNLDEKVIQRWFFAIFWIEHTQLPNFNIPTTQFQYSNYPTSICHQHNLKISDKSHKYTICGVGTSKSRSNLYKFTI